MTFFKDQSRLNINHGQKNVYAMCSNIPDHTLMFTSDWRAVEVVVRACTWLFLGTFGAVKSEGGGSLAFA